MTEKEQDWSSFYALLWNEKGLKLTLDMPETVIFREGKLSAWWITGSDGCVRRVQAHRTTYAGVRQHFLLRALEDTHNESKIVAIERPADGSQPRLLKKAQFLQCLSAAADREEALYRGEDVDVTATPLALQAYIEPVDDSRYLASYVCESTGVSFRAFARPFSARYARAESKGEGKHADGGVKEQTEVASRLHKRLDSCTSALVRHIEGGHDLAIAGIALEFVVDKEDRLYLLSVLRCEWAAGHASDVIQRNILHAMHREGADLPHVGGNEGEGMTGNSHQGPPARGSYTPNDRSEERQRGVGKTSKGKWERRSGAMEGVGEDVQRMGRRSMVAQLRKDYERATAELRRKEGDAEQAESRAEELQEELDLCQSSHQDVCSTLEHDLASVKGQLDQSKRKLDRLSSERKDAQARADARERERDDLQQRIAHQRERLVQAMRDHSRGTKDEEDNIPHLDQRRKDAEDALANERAAAAALQRQLEQYEEAIESILSSRQHHPPQSDQEARPESPEEQGDDGRKEARRKGRRKKKKATTSKAPGKSARPAGDATGLKNRRRG